MSSFSNISVYAIFNDQNFDDTLTNDIVSFNQLGLVFFSADRPKTWGITVKIQLHSCINRLTNGTATEGPPRNGHQKRPREGEGGLTHCRLNSLPHTIYIYIYIFAKFQGPVVQSIVSLTSSLVVKIVTVLVSIISNSLVFLLKKCE